MSDYTCDNWVVVKMKGDDPHYRLLVGTSGGYLDGDSWRMNSGITGVEKQAHLYGFYGSSGSVYWCHQGSYRLTMANAGVYNSLKENEAFEGQITLMPKDTNWMEIEW